MAESNKSSGANPILYLFTAVIWGFILVGHLREDFFSRYALLTSWRKTCDFLFLPLLVMLGVYNYLSRRAKAKHAR